MCENTEEMQRSHNSKQDRKSDYCWYDFGWKARRIWNSALVWCADDDCAYWKGENWERVSQDLPCCWLQNLQDSSTLKNEVCYWTISLIIFLKYAILHCIQNSIFYFIIIAFTCVACIVIRQSYSCCILSIMYALLVLVRFYWNRSRAPLVTIQWIFKVKNAIVLSW